MGQLTGSPGPDTAHLCIDMQRLFEPGAPWATPWLERVLPCVARTVFTRFMPPPSKHEAVGNWKAYYEKWECITGKCLDPALLQLVPALAKYAPPAAIIDRHVYSAFGNGQLQHYFGRHHVNTLIISGGETDACVLASVLAAVDFGYRVIIAEDAICSSSDQSHDALLSLYNQRFSVQIEVAPTDGIIASWSRL